MLWSAAEWCDLAVTDYEHKVILVLVFSPCRQASPCYRSQCGIDACLQAESLLEVVHLHNTEQHALTLRNGKAWVLLTEHSSPETLLRALWQVGY